MTNSAGTDREVWRRMMSSVMSRGARVNRHAGRRKSLQEH